MVTAKTAGQRATTLSKKPAGKVVRGSTKPSIAKHFAPPYRADEIRSLLGISEEDIQEARRLLRDTDADFKRKTKVAAKGKPAAAKLSD